MSYLKDAAFIFGVFIAFGVAVFLLSRCQL
jgi:hypothetical protein